MCGSAEGARVDTGAGGERCASAPPAPVSTRADFLSHAEQEVTPLRPLTPTQMRVWSGVAGTETRAQARARAAASPQLGAFIAVLDLPDNGQFGIARTGQRAGHSTVWGDADARRAAVVAVLPVESEEERHE